MASAKCPVCQSRVRVTKLNQLARHRNVDHKVCDNTGVPPVDLMAALEASLAGSKHD